MWIRGLTLTLKTVSVATSNRVLGGSDVSSVMVLRVRIGEMRIKMEGVRFYGSGGEAMFIWKVLLPATRALFLATQEL